MTRERWHGVAVAWVVLMGAAVRVAYVGRPAYLDESATFIDYARLPFGTIARTYFDPNNHVFYSLMMRASYLAFGFDLWALRLPALIAGVAVPLLVYLVGRRLYDRDVALLSAGMSAASAPLIEYSVSGRGYAFVTVCYWALLWLADYQREQPARWRWAAFALVAALGFYTLPTMLYPMGAVALWAALNIARERPRGLLGLMAALVGGAALTVALYAPILRAEGVAAIASNRHIVPLAYADLLPRLLDEPRVLLDFIGLGWPRIARYGLALPLLVGVVAGHRIAAERVPLWATTVLWVGAVVIVQRVIPPTRVWNMLVPLVLLWASAGVIVVWREWLRLGLTDALAVGLSAAALFGVVSAGIPTSYAIASGAHDAPAVAATIRAELGDDAHVLFVAGWVHPLWYYYERDGLPREQLWLNGEWAQLRGLDGPLYLLALTDDPYRDNRTREAFGVAIPPQALTAQAAYTEWTLYAIEPNEVSP